MPGFYVLKMPWATYVKEENFFLEQGGLSKTWGINWQRILADSIEDAREKANEMSDSPNMERAGSVLQLWVMRLPLREQGTLLTAVRGCDDEPKQWTSRGIAESPGRRLTAFIRWCFMNPADVREVDIPGSFFQSKPPDSFKPSEFGHLPQHWYSHAMHSLEVIAFRHPDSYPRVHCYELYYAMVHNLHLNAESKAQFIARLSEDRIAKGNVVS